jgi:heme/copper-type cytochrome/quinol oxidase subunit 2
MVPMRTRALLVMVALTAAACGSGADDTAVTVTDAVVDVVETTTSTGAVETTTTTAATTTTTAPETTTTSPAGGIDVTVAGGEVQVSGEVSVPVGEEVVLRVTSDVADHVHVHGYDLMADVAPDAPAELTFVADVPGIFEVELETAGLLLLQLEVGG